MITISGMDDFPTQLSVFPFPLADGRSILSCVHFPTPGTNEIAYTAVYLVSPAGAASKLGQSEPYGKDIDTDLEVVNLKLRLWTTEPPPGGGGAQAQVRMYEFDLPIGLALPGGGATTDTYARQQIAALDARLDRIAAGAAG